MKTIIVDGMHCQNCVKAINSALEDLGLDSVKVEVGKVEVTGNVDNKVLVDAIEGIGFDVVEIKES